jgi:DNA-binding NtrC family response regulator
MQPTNILIVEDNVELADLLAIDLKSRGHVTRTAHSAEDALALLRDCAFDVVVSDVNMGGMSGVELCRRVHARREDVPVVLMSAYGTLESAVAAIRAGAYDFIAKPFEPDHFSRVMDRALGLHLLRRELESLRAAAATDVVAPHLVGRSAALERVRALVARVAESESTVLITGESGTGKELAARAIHDRSERRSGAFVAINCAAMPEALLESELFGHSRGAFTDAKETRTGLFVQATHGTIFLDEIGDMPLGVQVKLLRTLQERRVRPVGSDHEVEFDARIIAATHRDLEADMQNKTFREDLYYRINVFRIHMPPLRARSDDTLIIAQRFLEHLAQQSKREVKALSSPVAKQLVAYPWPGNVRQLQNCIERAVAVARGVEIRFEDLPDEVRDYKPSKVDLIAIDGADAATFPTVNEIEHRYIRQVLTAANGNKTLAAHVLGFDRRTLYRKLDEMDKLADASRPD